MLRQAEVQDFKNIPELWLFVSKCGVDERWDVFQKRQDLILWNLMDQLLDLIDVAIEQFFVVGVVQCKVSQNDELLE